MTTKLYMDGKKNHKKKYSKNSSAKSERKKY